MCIFLRYFQLVSYFACEEGTTAQLLSDGSSPVSSQGPVVDLEERVLLRCVLETDEREADPTSPTEERKFCSIGHAQRRTLVLPLQYSQLV